MQVVHFLEHCDDCERRLGIRFENVNEWMDGAFTRFGPRHRFDRHHWEGVEKAAELFGEDAAKAAIIHIVRDCGHVPNAADYPPPDYRGVVLVGHNYKVDSMGIGEVSPMLLSTQEAFDLQVEEAYAKWVIIKVRKALNEIPSSLPKREP